MKISIDLPLFRDSNVEISDSGIILSGFGTTPLNRSPNLQKLVAAAQATIDVFFQNELTVNVEFLKGLEIDHNDITFEFVKKIFSDPQRVYALQNHRHVRFDQIEATIEQNNGPHTYDIGDNQYTVLTKPELVNYVFNIIEQDGTIQQMARDIVDDAYSIEDYFDVLDVAKLAHYTRESYRNNKTRFEELKSKSDEEVLVWAFDVTPKNLKSNIGVCINHKAFAKKYFKDDRLAIEKIEEYDDKFIFTGPYTLAGYKPINPYIIDRT